MQRALFALLLVIGWFLAGASALYAHAQHAARTQAESDLDIALDELEELLRVSERVELGGWNCVMGLKDMHTRPADADAAEGNTPMGGE